MKFMKFNYLKNIKNSLKEFLNKLIHTKKKKNNIKYQIMKNLNEF